MTIDPRFGFWFSIVMAIVSALGICGTQLTTLFGDIMANKILAAIVMLNVINSAINAILHAIPSKPGAANEFALGPKAVPVILLALILGAMAFPGDAHAQVKSIGQIQSDINAKLKTLDQLNQQIDAKAKAVVAPTDPTAALPCMDIKMLIHLTPENLVPTMKACVQDVNNQLVSDTSRALESAKAYVGPNGGATGDNDAVNCLKPALSLFKAAAIVPAVPEVPVALNSDGSVKTPAVAGTPELDPGPVLLFQKYREFTLAGALTSCQSWFNSPINATTAAGVAGVGTAVAGAALLAPK